MCSEIIISFVGWVLSIEQNYSFLLLRIPPSENFDSPVQIIQSNQYEPTAFQKKVTLPTCHARLKFCKRVACHAQSLCCTENGTISIEMKICNSIYFNISVWSTIFEEYWFSSRSYIYYLNFCIFLFIFLNQDTFCCIFCVTW